MKKKKNTWKRIKKYRFIYLMLLPILLYFVVFSYSPLIMGIIQSFNEVKLSGRSVFVGRENYQEVLGDAKFRQSIWNALWIGLGKWILIFLGGVIVAIGINELNTKWQKTLVQTSTYIPYLLSWTIVGGIWVFILSPNGLLNGILNMLGQSSPTLFMTKQSYGRWIMILTGVWKDLGYYAVLFLTSIVAINPNIFEAAQIDGASRFKQIRRLVLPEMVPTMKTVLVLSIMGLFTNFDQIFVMGNPAIIEKTRSPILYIYENGIEAFNVGIATAASVIVLVLTMVVTLGLRYLLERKDEV
ncbi:ABC transporter permease subunit [Fundicoccus sp. Sow4_H7]|uniref:ABC transporter permease subunit n=1 Tax=Fundicoccus sp. Sow4_H7 TaxID=3438784 RepID=UPI003F9200D6